MVFDIKSFYPFISLDLFHKAIEFASTITTITDNDIKSIMQSRKFLFFRQNESWIKRNCNENFDVPISCCDGTEVCELG